MPAIVNRFALSFSDPTGNFEKRSFQAIIIDDGLVVPQDDRDVAPHSRFLFAIDLSGSLHLADVADECVLHTNLLGVSSAGTPNRGVCFGEIQTDEFGRVSVINNRSGHTLPSASHLEYALSLPVFAELDPAALVESYAGQDHLGNAIINQHSMSDFRNAPR